MFDCRAAALGLLLAQLLREMAHVGRATISTTGCTPNKVIQSPTLNKVPLSPVPPQVKHISFASISSHENIVYLLICTLCQSKYVGETCCTLENRLVEHCADVRHKRTLLLPDISDFRVTLLTIIKSVVCIDSSIDKPP